MKNTTLTPRSLGCFQQVADVIGEYAAEVELQKVLETSYVRWLEGLHAKNLVDSFEWDTSPQGYWFWENIEDGDVPEGYTPDVSVEAPQEQPKQSPESQPEFGDVLHINGVPHVFIKIDHDGDWVFRRETDATSYHQSLSDFDEYAPDPTQEIREQILKDWQKQSLDHAYDTEVCRVESSVGDIINFILDNGYRKES